jgi:Domain of unknown function (DUF1896)
MKEILLHKLHEYIRENNPDVLFQLEEEGKLRDYLYSKVADVNSLLNQIDKGQPAYITEDTCMDMLTADLRPSKYNYICNLLEEEFAEVYQQLINDGLLKLEATSLVNHCLLVFEDLKFAEENEDNRFLRYAIIGELSEYLQRNSESEKVSNELQQSTEAER